MKPFRIADLFCGAGGTSFGAIALVEPFLVSFYGNGQAHDLSEPSPTVTCKDRFALVRPVVEVDVSELVEAEERKGAA